MSRFSLPRSSRYRRQGGTPRSGIVQCLQDGIRQSLSAARDTGGRPGDRLTGQVSPEPGGAVSLFFLCNTRLLITALRRTRQAQNQQHNISNTTPAGNPQSRLSEEGQFSQRFVTVCLSLQDVIPRYGPREAVQAARCGCPLPRRHQAAQQTLLAVVLWIPPAMDSDIWFETPLVAVSSSHG